MATIADFSVKPFSSEHSCKHLQCLKLSCRLVRNPWTKKIATKFLVFLYF